MNKYNVYHCSDCKTTKGSLHERGCDIERCPKCNGQLISCNCEFPYESEDYTFLIDDKGKPWKRFVCVSLDYDFAPSQDGDKKYELVTQDNVDEETKKILKEFGLVPINIKKGEEKK